MATQTTTITAPPRFKTSVNYYLDKNDGQEDGFVLGTAGFHMREYVEKTVNIDDIRGRENQFTLPKNGFEVIKHGLSNDACGDNDKITGAYADVEEAVRKAAGATKVKVFSHLIRRITKDEVVAEIKDKGLDANSPFTKSPPSFYVHCDNGPDGASMLLEQILGSSQADALKKNRWGIINVWKPLETVMKDPLAVCDYNTTPSSDLVNVYVRPQQNQNYGNFKGYGDQNKAKRFSLLQARANPSHHWYYCSKLLSEEALLFKIYDSNLSAEGRPQRTLHTAIDHQEVDHAPPRQSVEFRCFVFWSDEPNEEHGGM